MNSRPRGIVIVTTSYPIANDGSEAAGAFVEDVAMELAKCVPVAVVAPGREGSIERISDGLLIVRYPAPLKPLSTLKLWNPVDMVRALGVLFAGHAATRTAAKLMPARRIIALWALPSGHWARSVSRTIGIPYDVWTLGSDIWTLGRIPVIRNWLQGVLVDADRCFSDGLALAQDTQRLSKRQVEFLPSTRRTSRSRTSSLRVGPPFKLIFLGRWHPNKGVDILLDALSLLEPSDWSLIASCDIYGGGPMEALVRQRARSLAQAGHPVRVGGYLNRAEAEVAILAADWLVIPSRIESIPVVYSDAIKLGCPVITTPVGDLAELVGGHLPTGVVAKEVSPLALRDALRKALHCAPADFSTAMSQAKQRFSLTAIAQTLAA